MRQRTRVYVLGAIILFSVVVRLYSVNLPMTGHHEWRQSDTCMMIRNYIRDGYKLLYPEIDWFSYATVNWSEHKGYVECEFPIYQYFAALLSPNVASIEVVGRLFSIVLSACASLALFFLVSALAGESIAVFSVLAFAFFPRWMFFSSVTMPNPLLMTSAICGVLFWVKWARDRRMAFFVAAFLFMAISALIKPQMLYLGLPFLGALFVFRGPRSLLHPLHWLFSAALFGIVALWYYHSHKMGHLSGTTFGIWDYGSGKWGNWDLSLSWAYWKRMFIDFIAARHLKWVWVPFALLGLFLPRRDKKEYIFDCWTAGFLVYLFIVARGNYVHDYYQLSGLPPLAFYAGKGIVFLYSRIASRPAMAKPAATALTAALVFAAGYGAYDFYNLRNTAIDPTSRAKLETARIIEDVTSKDETILVDNGYNPIFFYLADRRGWQFDYSAVDMAEMTAFLDTGVSCVVLRSDEDLSKMRRAPGYSFEIRRPKQDYVVLLPMR